jgi:voltage-gated potassium channel
MSDAPISFTNHVVILGWDALAHRITRQLVLADKRVVVITRQTEARELIQESFSAEDVRVHLSDLNDWTTFDAVNIEQAFKVFVNLDSEEDSLVAILNLKGHYDGLEFDVVIDNPELEDTFYSAGVTYAVSTRNLASKLTAGHLFEPEVATYTSDLLSASAETGDHDIQQYELTDDNEYVGRTWGDLFWTLKDEMNCVPIGIGRSKPDSVGRTVTKMPDDDRPLRAGDHIILITDHSTEEELRALFGTDEGIRR